MKKKFYRTPNNLPQFGLGVFLFLLQAACANDKPSISAYRISSAPSKIRWINNVVLKDTLAGQILFDTHKPLAEDYYKYTYRTIHELWNKSVSRHTAYHISDTLYSRFSALKNESFGEEIAINEILSRIGQYEYLKLDTTINATNALNKLVVTYLMKDCSNTLIFYGTKKWQDTIEEYYQRRPIVDTFSACLQARKFNQNIVSQANTLLAKNNAHSLLYCAYYPNMRIKFGCHCPKIRFILLKQYKNKSDIVQIKKTILNLEYTTDRYIDLGG